jgi:hypothetical protein
VQLTQGAVWPWEKLLGANLMAQMRKWFGDRYEAVTSFYTSSRPDRLDGVGVGRGLDSGG